MNTPEWLGSPMGSGPVTDVWCRRWAYLLTPAETDPWSCRWKIR
jgi:hypothetical protein